MAAPSVQQHHGPTSSVSEDVCSLQRKTPLQLQTLEYLYLDDKYPTQSRLQDYASGLGLTYGLVKRWFVERRRRDKKNGNGGGRRKCNKKCTVRKQKLNSEEGDDGCLKSPPLLLDMSNISDYIPKKKFRKDGPPLGIEFDSLPSTAFQDIRDAQAASEDDQRTLKRRKGPKPANAEHQQQSHISNPVKKHGMGKGLMTVYQLNSQAACKENKGSSKRRKVLPSRDSSTAKRHGIGKGLMTVWRALNPGAGEYNNGDNLGRKGAAGPKQIKCSGSRKPLVQHRRPQKQKHVTPRRSTKKVQDERKQYVQRRKVHCVPDENQKKACRDICRLALDVVSSEEDLSLFSVLEDDEELELEQLQAGPNPLTCSAHFATSGRQGCSLCKGFLAKFPPAAVRMKLPLCMHPWVSSLELVKKLFKVFHFLYMYAVVIDICPFTFDEFAQAFSDKDSMLLGKVHTCLIQILLSDVEKELSGELLSHASKNCMFLNLLHWVENQKHVLKLWKQYLNPLTWTEILRQIFVAAGFGSKDSNSSKGCHDKEADQMVKYGIRPGTLKGELFTILLEQGNKGMKVSDLAKSRQITDLDLGKTNDELDGVICSILASDITLFEKISPSAYRLRPTAISKREDDSQSDCEDSGSIDNGSKSCSVHSINQDSECDSGNLNSRAHSTYHHPGETNSLGFYTEIDESHPGEAWLLGLMEGEYFDLSIEEKLNALLALVDLLSAGSSIRGEDPVTALAECVPRIYQHGSGAKIKRSLSRQCNSSMPWGGIRRIHGMEEVNPSSEFHSVDSLALISQLRGKEKSSKKKSNTKGTKIGNDLHPMQSIFLGSDRRYNRYWIFLGPCDDKDPGHVRVYFESSEDGHWEVIDSEESLCALLAALDNRGRREAVLLASLQKRVAFLLEEMSSRVTVPGFAQSDHADVDGTHEESSSPVSDVDNMNLTEMSAITVSSSGTSVCEVENDVEAHRQKWHRLQAYDFWIWNFFYSSLHAVRNGRRSYLDSLTRCRSCHDLYWRDEKHCRFCHTTFELDFDLEEKYAIHTATCRGHEDDGYPKHKVLPSQLQAIKAAIHAIESVMPEDAFIGAWRKSAHNLWVRRLRRTSSLHELLKVLSDFVGSINVAWFLKCNVELDGGSTSEDIVACFRNMPQTSSAVALWLVKLDALIASNSEDRPQINANTD